MRRKGGGCRPSLACLAAAPRPSFRHEDRLVSAEALGRVEKPLFDAVREDLYFFAKLGAVGLRPMVDHGLSGEVGHVRTQILTNHHSLAARARRERAMTGRVTPG